MMIGDLTRAFDSNLPKFVYALCLRAQITQRPATIVCHSRQRTTITVLPSVTIFAVDDAAPPSEIARIILEELIRPALAGPLAFPLEVFSYHMEVSYMVTQVAEHPRRVVSLPWRALRADGKLIDDGPLTPRRSGTPVIPETAFAVLANVLRNFPYGIMQSDLRNELVVADSSLDKYRGGPSMSVLVAAARDRGLVVAEPWGHVNPRIRLAATSQILAVAAGTLPVENKTGVSDQSAPVEVGQATEIVGQEASNERKSLEPADRTDNDSTGPATRVQEFFGVFRKNDFGPYRQGRYEYYDEIEQLVAERKYSAALLIKKAAKAVESRRRTNPWSIVEKFLRGLFSRQAVLLSEGDCPQAPNDPASASKAIVALAPNWRDRLEGELLVFLAEKHGDFRFSNLDSAAFVIFPSSGGDEAMIRAEALFEILLAEGRITVINDVIIPKPIPSLSVVASDETRAFHPPETEGEKTG